MSHKLLTRRKIGMFSRFERKLILVGGTLNMTASFLMLTALLVSLNNCILDDNCRNSNPSDFPRLLLEPGLPPVS